MTSILADTYETFDELHRLVAASLAGNMSREDNKRLEELVGRDVKTRSLYLDIIHETSILLTWATRGGVEDNTAASAVADQDGSNEYCAVVFATKAELPASTCLFSSLHSLLGYLPLNAPMAYCVATVVVGIGLAILAVIPASQATKVALHSPSAIEGKQPVVPKEEIVGRITGMVDCNWDDPKTAPSHDAPVSTGHKYALASGLMEITYDSGAKVILQGPVTYEVESMNGGFMQVGKLTGKVEVEAAKGFTVRTPTATVTDLGTEFGVAVDQQGCTTSHVFRGEIEVQLAADDAKQDGRTFRLTKNESVRIEKHNNGKAMTVQHGTANPAAFVLVEQFSKLVREQSLTPFHRWKAYSRQLRQDPALVAYYTFESAGQSNEVLPNRSPAGKLLDGQVQSAEWVYGRMPGKFALLFHGPNSGDKVVLPEQNLFNFAGPFSVAIWFKVGEFTGFFYAPLITKEDNTWRLQQKDGEKQLQFVSDSSNGIVSRTDGRTEVADHHWHLAVAVYEPIGHVARQRLYIDGRLDAESDAPLPLNRNDTPVLLGANDKFPERTFRGLIDEVAIFARALSAEEVAKMFVETSGEK
jgi:hypothetical protein